MSNPWAVNAMEDFLYYCCPVCEERHQSQELFFQHAFETHPQSKQYILPFKLKSEENETFLQGYEIKVEAIECEAEDLSLTQNDIDLDHSTAIESDCEDNCEDIFDNSDDQDAIEYHGDQNSGLDTKPSSQPNVLHDCFLSECSFQTKKVKDLILHLETSHQIVESLTCKICNNTFLSKWYLYDHLGLHFKQKSFNCDECDKEFLYTYAMKVHKRNVHSENKVLKKERIPCIIKDCISTALNMKDILIHLEKVHQEVDSKAKSCLKCNKRIGGNSGILYYHMKRHYEDIEFVCSQCGKSFTNPYSLKIHENYVHTEAKWNCDKCGVNLKTKESLQTHQASVHDKVRYHCDKCEKSFVSLYKLKKHVERFHEGKIIEKNEQCDICGNKFQDKSNLKRHVALVHDKVEAGMKCQQCDKTFTSKKGLSCHVRFVHQQERNFTCKICNSSFHSGHYLKLHTAAVHDGIKQFKCDKCEKAFTNRFGLTRHEENFHQGKRYECDKCSKTFTQKCHLKKHLEQDHK